MQRHQAQLTCRQLLSKSMSLNGPSHGKLQQSRAELTPHKAILSPTLARVNGVCFAFTAAYEQDRKVRQPTSAWQPRQEIRASNVGQPVMKKQATDRPVTAAGKHIGTSSGRLHLIPPWLITDQPGSQLCSV